jgi:hypothetical protein
MVSFKSVQQKVIVMRSKIFGKYATDGRFWSFPKFFDLLTMTFGCTDLNETNANIFYFESSFTQILDLDDQTNCKTGLP